MNACPTCGCKASYLGLVFDWKARWVSRAQRQPVRLPHSLMTILEALADGHGEPVGEAALLAAYRGGAATCDRLMSKKVSFLRGAIAPLGLSIAAVRGRGYRLSEAA